MYDNCCLVHWQTLFYPISANASLYCKDNTGRKSRWVVLSHTSLALAKTLTKRLYVWLNVEFMHAIQCFNSLLTCSMFNQDHNLSLILTKYEKHIILFLSFPFHVVRRLRVAKILSRLQVGSLLCYTDEQSHVHI